MSIDYFDLFQEIAQISLKEKFNVFVNKSILCFIEKKTKRPIIQK